MRHAFDAALMQAGEKVSDYKEAFDKYVEFFTSNTVTPDPKAILREDAPAEVTFAFAAHEPIHTNDVLLTLFWYLGLCLMLCQSCQCFLLL